MANTKNGNFDTAIKQLLVPGKLQLTMYFLITLLALVIADAKEYVAYYQSQFGSPSAALPDINNKTAFFNYLADHRLAEIFFWGALGIFVYMAVWFLNNVFINIRNDFKTDSYVHPPNYKSSGFWESVVFSKVYLLGLLGLCVVFVYASLVAVSYTGEKSYGALVVNRDPLHSSLVVAGSIFLIMALLHLVVVLVNLLIQAWKVVYKGL